MFYAAGWGEMLQGGYASSANYSLFVWAGVKGKKKVPKMEAEAVKVEIKTYIFYSCHGGLSSFIPSAV